MGSTRDSAPHPGSTAATGPPAGCQSSSWTRKIDGPPTWDRGTRLLLAVTGQDGSRAPDSDGTSPPRPKLRTAVIWKPIPAAAPRPDAGPCHRVRPPDPRRDSQAAWHPYRDTRTAGPRPGTGWDRRRRQRLSIAGRYPPRTLSPNSERPFRLTWRPSGDTPDLAAHVPPTRMVAGRGYRWFILGTTAHPNFTSKLCSCHRASHIAPPICKYFLLLPCEISAPCGTLFLCVSLLTQG